MIKDRNWGERLREALERKGWTQAELARRVVGKDGRSLVPEASIRKYVNGKVDQPRGKTVEALANALDVDLEWLRTGREASPSMIPVVGYVGAGAEIYAVDDHLRGAGLAVTEAPPGASRKTFAVKVRGDSMWPSYRENDIIIYDEPLTDIVSLIGRECVIRTADGRSFVKVLTPGSLPGSYTLNSFNAPPVMNVRVEWAARIVWVKKA